MDFSQGFCRQSGIPDNNYLNCLAGKLIRSSGVNFEDSGRRGDVMSQTLACIGRSTTSDTNSDWKGCHGNFGPPNRCPPHVCSLMNSGARGLG